MCAAGQASTLPLRFAIERPGRFAVYRGEVLIGVIELKAGGWLACETINGRPHWTAQGRIRAKFAAHDMWGATAAGQVGLLPDNRPEQAPQENGAQYRRNIERGNEVTP